ncbi:MAG: hypothetical protein MAG715_00503 [Methanonatronarchaeales archaeon]|nr:hypothetical protein [Methanonatronarchaeales archaeon]
MVQESISGFKREGTWEQVVEHGEKISDILAEEGVEGDDFSDWESWRPRSREDLCGDVTERTAEKVSIETGKGSGIREVGRKLFCKLEETVYSRVMSRVGPQYFDNDLVSANIERIRNGSDRFRMEVIIHPPDTREAVGRGLKSETES